ncbi:MAG TPA: transketolase C-terminal domain-containing protein [Kiritimatiellia bacterium]|jgi:transketolase
MRKACLLSIYDLARRDDRVVFIGSDITKRDLEKLSEEFADRFFMEGVYEAHIIGMAAGMALNGKMPYINTIATFLTRRCFEQVLLDVCLHKLPVRLIGSGGGTVYAPLGPTHLANEDIAILRAIPNMTVVAPCDADEMKRLMPATLAWPGPIYIRLAKGGDAVVSSDANGFAIGKAIRMRQGGDAVIVSTGVTTQLALKAAAELEQQGAGATVLHMHTLKPFDDRAVLDAARGARAVVTIEEHTLVGGLGSAVAEVLMEAGLSGLKFKRLGIPDVFTEELGSQNDIMGKYGISVPRLVETVLSLLRSK